MVEELKGYCVRCKEKQTIKNPVEAKTSKGVNMIKGICSVCKTKMCRILGKK